METEDPQDNRRQKGGHHCIVLGCKNEFYSAKAKEKTVHFHKLPWKRSTVLQRWLAALKRKNPPINSQSRVCSEHFLEEDYIKEKAFESDKLVIRPTNRLKADVVPSVFNLTTSDLCSTDRRRKRALKRDSQTGKTQVGHEQDTEVGRYDINYVHTEKEVLTVICHGNVRNCLCVSLRLDRLQCAKFTRFNELTASDWVLQGS